MTNVHYISSSSDLLKKQLGTIHSIINDGSNNSSVMEYIYSTSREKLLFQEKVINLEAQIKILREALALQSAEFSFQKSEYEKEIEQLKKKLKVIMETHVQNFQTQILNSQSKTEIKSKHNEYNEQKQTTKIEKKNSDEIQSQLEQEQKKFKSAVNKYRTIYSKYTDISKKYKQKETENAEVLNHIENERNEVYELLKVKKDEISREWTNLINKLKDIVEENHKLKTNNEKLNKRIQVANDSIKEHQKTQNEMNQKIVQYENIISSSPSSTKTGSSSSSPLSKNILNSPSSSSSIIKTTSDPILSSSFRTQFSITIDKINFNSQNQIFNLYDSLIPNGKTKLRSIFLSVIFIIRFKTCKSRPLDPTSLSLFYGRDEFSINNAIKQIGEKFTELTHDLLIAKQSRNDIEAEMIRRNDKIREMEAEVSNKKELELKIEWYKKRMIELEEYLSTLVSPEQYYEARTRADRLEEENLNAEQKRKEIEKEFESYNQNSIEVAHQIKDLTICAEVKTQEAHEMRFECANKESEIESLKAIIQEKNKAILAMERTIILQKQVNEKASSNLACLAIENQNLLRESQSCSNSQSFTINPTFLQPVDI